MADKKFDLTEIMKEYGEDDFGFTATDEEEYNSVIAEKEETVEEYKQRLHEVEKLVLPFDGSKPFNFSGGKFRRTKRNQSKKRRQSKRRK